MKGYIYKITNKVNGKSYIGQTRNSVEFRWRQHKNNKNGYALHAAIRKYGAENFEVETLEKCDISRLDEREIYYIDKYDTFNNGYNLSKGGDCTPKKNKLMYVCVDNKYEEMQQMYLAGFSLMKIASIYHVNKRVIKRMLESLGVKIRTHNHLKLNKQEQLEIVQRYNNGESLNQIAKSYECGLHQISQIFQDNGGILRKPLFDDEERIKRIINMYLDETIKVRKILDDEKISYSALYDILDMYNIELRGGPKRLLEDEEIKQEIVSQYKSGLNMNQIAEQFNVSTTPIKRILKENNIVCRQYKFSKSVQVQPDNAVD